MKKSVFLFLLPLCLCSCGTKSLPEQSKILYGFDTYLNFKVYREKEYFFGNIEHDLNLFSKECDFYHKSDVNGVFQINFRENTWVDVSENLYNCLKKGDEYTNLLKGYFSIYLGALSGSWKTSLKNGEVLSDRYVEMLLSTTNNTKFEYLDSSKSVRRRNYGEIDLGSFAKGYFLDHVKACFVNNGDYNFIVDAGSSSILLGEKPTNDGLFTIKISSLDNSFIETKNTFVSTSSIDNQIYTIDGKQYSHIINPKTGRPETVNQTCVVLTDTGALGDALSTAMMLMDIDQVKIAEEQFNAKAIVIRDRQVVYKNPGITIING